MSTHANPTSRSPKTVTPAYLEVLILDTLSKGARQSVLEAIMQTHGAMVRLQFIQDWDHCDAHGDPTYIFEGASALPQALHDSLLARGAIKPHYYFPRSDWAMALHCARHAGHAPRPAWRARPDSPHLHLV